MSVLVAAGLDVALGEPPLRMHPVHWAGRYLDAASARVPAAPPANAVAAGGVAWVGGAAAALAAGLLLDRMARRHGAVGRAVLRGTALWPLLSGRLLLAEVRAVDAAVARSPEQGRAALTRIVSRDPAGLSASEVRAAALESLAENLSDSVVAPLCWYAVAGLPGAALYRFANTADACWGYRTPRWQHAGRVAARADDVLNLAPARIAAVLLLGPGRTQQLPREARKTASPNAGWPMAALALRLDLRLGKRGHYELHAKGADPGPADVGAGLRLARRAMVAALAGAALIDLMRNQLEGAR